LKIVPPNSQIIAKIEISSEAIVSNNQRSLPTWFYVLYVQCIKTKNFNLIFVEKILHEPLPFIRALIKGTRSFVARALKNALMREHRLPALGS
jgi:hypothetical protein